VGRTSPLTINDFVKVRGIASIAGLHGKTFQNERGKKWERYDLSKALLSALLSLILVQTVSYIIKVRR
jgi:hypothetical protein